MNKIFLVFFFLIIGCKEIKDFEYTTRLVTSYHVILNSESNIGELLDFDEKGNFYLTNKSTKQIYKYSPKGELLAKTGRIGRGPNEFEKDKVLNIDVGNNTVLAHSQGGYVINKYDSNLKIIDSYLTEKSILDVTLLNDQKILIAYVDMKMGNPIEVRDSKFNKLFDSIDTLHHSSPFYGFLFTTSSLSEYTLIVSYLAVNQIRIFSTEGDLIKIIEVPGFPDQAPILEDIPRKAPAYLLFRDVYVDSINNNILILEGDRTHYKNNALNYAGSNLVHFLSSEGNYQYTIELPMGIEQIAHYDKHMYGLQVDSLSTKIIRFNSVVYNSFCKSE